MALFYFDKNVKLKEINQSRRMKAMKNEVVDDCVNRFLLGEAVHKKTIRLPEAYPSIDRCT